MLGYPAQNEPFIDLKARRSRINERGFFLFMGVNIAVVENNKEPDKTWQSINLGSLNSRTFKILTLIIFYMSLHFTQNEAEAGNKPFLFGTSKEHLNTQ